MIERWIGKMTVEDWVHRLLGAGASEEAARVAGASLWQAWQDIAREEAERQKAAELRARLSPDVRWEAGRD